MIKELLIIYVLVGVGLSLIVAILKKDKYLGIVTLAINIMYPIGGYLFTIMLCIERESAEKGIQTLEIKGEDLLYTVQNTIECKKEIIPFEEVLLINADTEKRKDVLYLLKENPLRYITLLQLALKDEDTETVHYASSAISEINRKINLDLQKYNAQYKAQKEDEDFLEDYLKLIQTCMNTGLLDQQNLLKYKDLEEEIIKKLINKYPKSKHYSNLCDIYIQQKDITKLKSISREFLEFEKVEESFIARLQYYFLKKDIKGFKEIMTQFKQSELILSHQGMEHIKFWMEAENEN